MSTTRLLAAFAAGALVTVPGLALAQGGLLTETPVEVETPSETVTPAEEETPAEAETPVEEAEEDRDPEPLERVEDAPLEPLEAEGADGADEDDGDDGDDGDDDGHGETISTLARCLPSGRELHGTGFTKGFVMSQAASTGRVVIEAHEVGEDVTTPQEAEDVCALVTAIAESAEAPDTAKGRPDWAGPKDDVAGGPEVEDDAEVEGEDDAAGRGGPPPWAGRRGGPKGPR